MNGVPLDRAEEFGGRRFVVRPVSGALARKVYRCPGCDHDIGPGTPHVVVWPSIGRDQGVADRRHWHTPCWSARARRRPRHS